ncbi:hypothetical protein [Maribacter litoralis]|uniref:hypothetical protein n=1 Tax=Maribacter litoralis TaxID=2059726 RepID=UPI003F5CF065
MKNKLFFIIISILSYSSIYAQNLIQTDDWVAGTSGSTVNYSMSGSTEQNSRVEMLGPYGTSTVVWQALADGDSGFNGGFTENGIVLNTNNTYRISLWVRSTGNNNCLNYTGFIPYDSSGERIISTMNETGSSEQWPYFSNINTPNDTWFLVVGYIRPGSATDLGDSGIYNPLDGAISSLPQAIAGTTDYIFPANETNITTQIRAFMYACGSGETMSIAFPRVEEINGQELTLSELLYGEENYGGTEPVNPGSSVWTTDGQNINYSLGNVGIGTEALVDFKLAIDGNVRAREIKVDTEVWPDYVFSNDYDLLSLEEVKMFIDKNGHLPNIPSALEIESNGLELGEMNRLLLEKIEELTLYILNQEKRIELLEQINKK